MRKSGVRGCMLALCVVMGWAGTGYAVDSNSGSSGGVLREWYDTYFANTQFFVEGIGSVRIGDERTDKDEYNVLEERVHGETTLYPDMVPGFNRLAPELKYSGEILVDQYDEAVRYETREASLFMRPASFSDLKVGRQILTWGTGDYLFINDMFPKDYISFFIGRDDEYLKKPSDAVRFSLYHRWANIDAVFIPWFTPNTVVQGDRLSFYDSFRGEITGEESERFLLRPPHQFENSEVALRLFKTLDRYEVAGYFFNGFMKNPQGYKNNTDTLYYPPVSVYGTSLRGPALGGIGSLEAGYNDSHDDRKGTDRMVENSMMKYLLGYSRGFRNDLTLGVQYYVEQIMKYDEHKKSLVAGDYKRDHFREVATFSLRKDFLQQTLHCNSFIFYSPTDEDVYWRPSVTYDITDHLKATLGGNFFWGTKDFTEFGQFEENKNFYVRVRYSY